MVVDRVLGWFIGWSVGRLVDWVDLLAGAVVLGAWLIDGLWMWVVGSGCGWSYASAYLPPVVLYPCPPLVPAYSQFVCCEYFDVGWFISWLLG